MSEVELGWLRGYPVAESSFPAEGSVIVEPQPTCPPGTICCLGRGGQVQTAVSCASSESVRSCDRRHQMVGPALPLLWGCALSKQRLSHWVVDVITHAYKGGGHPLPSGVRCHSTRAVSTSWAALRGVPLEDICDAASWTSPCTFSRFYRVNVATPHPLAVVLLPDSAVPSQ